MPTHDRLTAPDGLAPGNGFCCSSAVDHRGHTAYVSGQVALDASGSLVGGDDVAAQTEQCLANIGAGVRRAARPRPTSPRSAGTSWTRARCRRYATRGTTSCGRPW